MRFCATIGAYQLDQFVELNILALRRLFGPDLRPVQEALRETLTKYTCGHCQQCLANGWPRNARWASDKQQARNTKRNRMITVRGITGCVSELCEMFGISRARTHWRLMQGWEPEAAFFTPDLR